MASRTVRVSFSQRSIAKSGRNKPRIEKLNETFFEGVSVYCYAFQGNIA